MDLFRQAFDKINSFRLNQIVLPVLFLLLSFSGFSSHPEVNNESSEHGAAVKEEGVDISALAFGHILDQHSWHLWGEGVESVAIPLPIIIYSDLKGLQFFMSSRFEHGHAEYNGYSLDDEKIVSANPTETFYDLSITKNVAQLFISMFVLIMLFISVAKTYKNQGVTSAPKGKQSFLEPLVMFVRDDIARTHIGPKSDKFVPYLLSLFFLILINNIFGLIPVSANVTGNIAFTLVLSVFTLIIVNINGNKHYWGHIFKPHAPKALWPILIPLELIGLITKPFALMIRLFANITAGHMIIIALISLIFLFKTIYIAPLSIAFSVFIDILEVLVAVLQAYIFTLLTALFIGSAVGDTNEDGAHTKEDEELAKAGH
jgi:F-type H+-transporting ATPase subunit a